MFICMVTLLGAANHLSAADKNKKVFEPVAEVPPGESPIYVYVPAKSGGKFQIKVNGKSLGTVDSGKYLSTTGSGQLTFTSHPMFKFMQAGILDQVMGQTPLNLSPKLKIDTVAGQAYYIKGIFQNFGAGPTMQLQIVDPAVGFQEIRTLTEGKHK
jgi:hypothetical protein